MSYIGNISKGAADALYWNRSAISLAWFQSLFGERRYATVIDVPGDYATIALALAGSEVSAASFSSRVLIRLQEGTYNEYLPMDSYYFVDVQGMGIDQTILNYTSDAHDTVSWGGGDCLISDMTINHPTGSSLRAGHKDNQTDTSKLTYSRGGAVRCKITGVGKSGMGMRLYANQEFAMIDCIVSTSTTQAIYHNNATSSQSAPSRLYLINCTATSTATEGLGIYSCGSGQKDEVVVIGGKYTGGAGDDIRTYNSGGGAGEIDLWVDTTTIAPVVTATAGTSTLHTCPGRVYSTQVDPTFFSQIKTTEVYGAVSSSATAGWKATALTDTYGVRYRLQVYSSAEAGYINSFDIDPYDGRLYVRRLLQAQGGLRISSTAPANSSAAGEVGQIATDASYIYVCTASNTWKRAALSSF